MDYYWIVRFPNPRMCIDVIKKQDLKYGKSKSRKNKNISLEPRSTLQCRRLKYI